MIACVLIVAGSAAGLGAAGGAQDTPDDALRREGTVLVRLADEAMSGPAAADFPIAWHNDFFKAQTGTFVPFTVTLERSDVSASSALMYVRATRRETVASSSGRPASARYPFDLIFPVDFAGSADGAVRITRGFAVPPGEYDVYVVVRERAPDPGGPAPRLKAAVLKQPLTVPDFWTGELATSSVMLAERIETLTEAPGADELLERPYAIGENEVHPAAHSSFRKDRELIVVFLIYNASVSAERNFDVQVDYHLFRALPAGTPRALGSADDARPDGAAPRAGEQYVTHTNPQRFKPSSMGAHFDPTAGHPMMAGQGILLSSFQVGAYRLGITVTDLLSRRTLSRDVTFTVVGS